MKYFNVGGQTTTETATAPPDPLTGTKAATESSLSNWAGDYVTDMLGKGQALSNLGYEAYTGQMTAGPSDLQQQAFAGVAGLTVPQDMGAFQPQQFTAETAQQYMNPYLQGALDPQLDEARRQAEISRIADAGRLTKAGAFGGSRQAIMEAEGQRNLLRNMSDITARGYNTAFDQARDQFNVEQGRMQTAQDAANRYGLSALQAQQNLGAQQRQIEQDALSADYKQFQEELLFPYKQVQFQQSLLENLPLETQSYSYNTPSQASNVLGGIGGILEALGYASGN